MLQEEDLRTGRSLAHQNNTFGKFNLFVLAAIFGVVLLIVLVHLGFSKTYIQHFPAFSGFTMAQHVHGVLMMGWLLMLLVQPLLILKNKIQLHKQVGKLSYVLAPLVVFSIWWVAHTRYHEYLGKAGQTKDIISWLSLNFRLMLFFATLYFLAIYYKAKPALHMRFMVSTALVLIGPGLVRALISYTDMSRLDSHNLDRNINVLVAAVLTIIDSWRTKRLSPFTVVLVFMLLQKILWDMRNADFLQATGMIIAKLF